MAAMSDYLENKLIDHIFRGVSFTAPVTLYVALLTASPADPNTSGGLEIGTTTPNGYARVAITCSTANWASTGGATTTTNPSAGTSGTTSNNGAIAFPAPTGNWFNGAGPAPTQITHFGIYDAATIGAGNLMFHGALTTAKTVNSGDAVPTFAISALSLQVDN